MKSEHFFVLGGRVKKPVNGGQQCLEGAFRGKNVTYESFPKL